MQEGKLGHKLKINTLKHFIANKLLKHLYISLFITINNKFTC